MDIYRAKDIDHKNPTTRADYPYAFSNVVFNTSELFISSEKVHPGKQASIAHFHPDMDEVVMVTKGEVVAFEGESSTILKVGDWARFPASEKDKHYLENQTNEDSEFILIRRGQQS